MKHRKRCLGCSGCSVGRHENGTPHTHQSGIFMTIKRGERVIGHSKIRDNREFTWKD